MRTLEEIVGFKFKSFDFWQRSSLYCQHAPTILWEAAPDVGSKIAVSVAFAMLLHPVTAVSWGPVLKSLGSYAITRVTLPAVPSEILKDLYEIIVPKDPTVSKIVTAAIIVSVIAAATLPIQTPPKLSYFSGSYLCLKNKLTETANYARKISANLIK